MQNAPEGLEYGTDNYRYAKADKPEAELEKGKVEMGEKHLKEENNLNHPILKEAMKLPETAGCSMDPCYGNQGRNKK